MPRDHGDVSSYCVLFARFVVFGRTWYVRIWELVACLGVLTLLLIYLMEYDYGIPQFSLLNRPVMLAAFVALPFVLARAWIGPWGPVAVLAVFLVARSLIFGINILVGEMRPVFPVLIAELLIVELTALVVRPQRNRSPSGPWRAS